MTNVDEQAEAVGEAIAAGEVLEGHAAPEAAGGWTRGSVYVLAILTLISTLNYFDRSVISLVLPLIKAEFKVSDATLGAVTGLILFYAVFGIPIAWIAERWSRKYVIAIGLTFWSVMTSLTSLAANVWQLGLYRFLMGIGEGCGLAPSQSMLSDIFSAAKRPVVLSILTTASSVAAIVYSPIAGQVAGHYGWRATFLIAGIPGIVLALIFVLTVREPKRRAPEGAVAPPPTEPLWRSLGFLMGSRAYVLCLIGTTIMGVYLYGVGAWGTMLLVRVRHMTVPEVGTYIAPVRGAVAAVGILLGGALASWLDRFDGRWRCWIAGVACLVLAPCEFLYVFGPTTNVWVPAMLAASLFSIMHQGPIYAAYVSVARPRMRAVSVSVALLGATVAGQFGGPLLIGMLNDALRPQFGDLAIRYSMLVVMACAAAAGLCYIAAGRFVRQDTARAAEA
jgi:MFS family permease